MRPWILYRQQGITEQLFLVCYSLCIAMRPREGEALDLLQATKNYRTVGYGRDEWGSGQGRRWGARGEWDSNLRRPNRPAHFVRNSHLRHSCATVASQLRHSCVTVAS